MESTKASALEAEAERLGLALLRFDYSGHGSSEGRLEDGTISRWLEETLAMIRSETEGPQIVLGSSMGGYLALLAVRALSESGEAERLAGLILIAPAVDFTEALVWERAPEAARRAIIEDGAWRRPSAYSNEPDVFTRALIEDGRKHLLFNGMIRTFCPTVVLQGMRDEDVPYAARAQADGAPRRRPGDADPRQGRRPPPVATAGFAAPVRRGGKDGVVSGSKPSLAHGSAAASNALRRQISLLWGKSRDFFGFLAKIGEKRPKKINDSRTLSESSLFCNGTGA